MTYNGKRYTRWCPCGCGKKVKCIKKIYRRNGGFSSGFFKCFKCFKTWKGKGELDRDLKLAGLL